MSSLVFCWRVERRDGAGLAITSHDSQVTLNGRTFKPATSFDPAAVTRGGWNGAMSEAKGSVTSDGLSEADLVSGRWSGARSTLYAVEWAEDAATPHELAAGELGEVVMQGSAFQADLLGISARLNEDVCPVTSPECRAALGDRNCRVNLAGRTVRTCVVSGSGNKIKVEQPLDERFARGHLRWLGGPNCGLKSYIIAVDGDVVCLREPPPFATAGNETVRLVEGCDKRLQTCRDRFGNVSNFRGEPHLPGNDLLTRYPGA